MKTRVAKRSIAGALIMAMLVMMLLPMSVMAASNEKVKVLKPGQWATESEWEDENYNYHYDYYKIILKKPGRINFKSSIDGDASLYFTLEDCKDESDGNGISNNDKLIVDKGTYYLRVRRGKVKYTFTEITTPTNYSITKAKTLKANKKVYNVFTPRTNFVRWFKVTIPKKKKIVFWSNDPEAIVILNSKLQQIPVIAYGSDVRYCTKKVVPKGTYYMGVKGWGYHEYYAAFKEVTWTGETISLKWK